jgi:gamma-glutamyl hercynylcysteine S-oxide synthase
LRETFTNGTPMISGLTRERETLLGAYGENRRRTAQVFELIASEAYYERPIPLRHPFAFYDGHIPSFSFSTLVRNALGEEPVDEELEQLFRRGIDPGSTQEASATARDSWPTREEIRLFAERCDERVRHALTHADLDVEPAGEAAGNIIEHEQMHQETLLYIVQQLSDEKKRKISPTMLDGERPPYRRVVVPAGIATLGARRDAVDFGWDNEFEEHSVEEAEFEIEADNVTNGDYLSFVEAGGDPAPFWRRANGTWELKTVFDRVALPLSWPVYVTHDQAAQYAAWKNMRLPSEAEYHRAAFGVPDGSERLHPWGDAPPDPARGNFGFKRFDPVPIGSFPRGTSAWGVNDLVGNGWEWTNTLFAPFPGFRPMATYPVYSTDFFDGEHFVMKGASPLTNERLVRRSFRNWFRHDYPYVPATFRCVS